MTQAEMSDLASWICHLRLYRRPGSDLHDYVRLHDVMMLLRDFASTS